MIKPTNITTEMNTRTNKIPVSEVVGGEIETSIKDDKHNQSNDNGSTIVNKKDSHGQHHNNKKNKTNTDSDSSLSTTTFDLTQPMPTKPKRYSRLVIQATVFFFNDNSKFIRRHPPRQSVFGHFFREVVYFPIGNSFFVFSLLNIVLTGICKGGGGGGLKFFFKNPPKVAWHVTRLYSCVTYV